MISNTIKIVNLGLTQPTTIKDYKISSSINLHAIVQPGAIVNDATNPNNLNIIIIGMIIVIIILVGVTMFTTKK